VKRIMHLIVTTINVSGGRKERVYDGQTVRGIAASAAWWRSIYSSDR
jgi:hypothetical protein